MASDEISEAARLREEADDLLGAGRPEEAIRRLNFALDILRGKCATSEEARVLESFAHTYRVIGQMDKAEQSTRAALACWMTVEDRAEEARALGLLANLRISQGNLEDGEFWLRSSLKVVREVGNRAGEADILRSFSALLLRKGELPQAEDCARQAISLFADVDDKLGEARALGIYAQMLMRRAAFAEARAVAERCQALFEQAGDKQGVTRCLQVRSAIMRREGRLAEAEQLLTEILRQKRESKDVVGEAGAMNTLALVIMDSGGERRAEAERLLLRAIELYNSVNDRQNAALVRQNLADVYLERGRAHDAELVLGDALKIHESTGSIESQARTLSAIAGTLCSRGKIGEALDNYRRSIELARQLNDQRLVAAMICPWVTLRVMLADIDEGAAALEDALGRTNFDDDVLLRYVLPLRIRIALAGEDILSAESALTEALQRLNEAPPELHAPLRGYLKGAHEALEAAQAGRKLYYGFIPELIDTQLRRTLVGHLKENKPAAFGRLDVSIVQAMNA